MQNHTHAFTGMLALLLALAYQVPAQDLPPWDTNAHLFLTVDMPSPDLSFLPPGPFGVTTLTDINDHGSIVGNTINSSLAFLLDRDSTFVPLACPAPLQLRRPPALIIGGK